MNINDITQIEKVKKDIENTPKHAIKALMGQKDLILPIDSKKTEILDAIRDHDELIITAETGAGKSTRVPQYLAEAGYNVVVTQPRILAAISLADRVAEEMGTVLGDVVGYHVGGHIQNAKNFSSNTKVKFCTDGLQLVKQLMDRSIETADDNVVLVIDEVHEWNQNIEVLVAWSKKLKKSGKKIKIVLMSATIDAENLAEYYTNQVKNDNEETIEIKPPLIEVKGRNYPVERSQEEEMVLIDKTIDLVREKRNILIFQPGKKEITETIKELEMKLRENEAIILPLHGELTPEEQSRIYKRYNKPVVIVSTNIAQTSITIPYIDAVVDSGKERRMEIINGVETLVLGDISQADSKQRGGRAGRTKPGVYILCNDTPFHQFQEYPKPEIQRTMLDHNYLKILSSTGLKMEELEFFHQPPIDTIEKAKSTLHVLGAIDRNDQVTSLGKHLASLPVDVNTGRMIIESLKHGVTDDILKIAAIRQVGGILARDVIISNNIIDKDSDLITQLNLLNHGKKIHGENNIKNDKEELFNDAGIFTKKYYMALDHYRNLKDVMNSYTKNGQNKPINDEQNKESILKCITAGMLDSIYKRDGFDYVDKNHDERQKGRESSTSGHSVISAEPKNIQFKNRRGYHQQINIVTNISKTKPEWLEELAPHLIEHKKNSDRRDSIDQKVIYQEDTHFNGLHVDSKNKESPLSDNGVLTFCNALANGYEVKSKDLQKVYKHNEKVRNELVNLRRRTGSTKEISDSDLRNYYREVLHNKRIQSTNELEKYLKEEGSDIFMLNDTNLLIRDYDKLIKQYPEKIVLNGKEYDISYSLCWGGHSIRINIPQEDIENINHDDFEQGLFEKKAYKFTIIKEDGYNKDVDNLDLYKKEIDEDRIQRKWEDFIDTFSGKLKTYDFSERSGEWTINEKMYDQKSSANAYLGLLSRSDEYLCEEKWFKDKSEAKEVTDITQERYKKYLEYKENIKAYEEKYQEIAKKFNYIDEELNWDGWEHTGYSYSIRTKMSDSFDYLKRYDDKDILDIERAENLLLEVQEILEKAKSYKKQYEKVAVKYNSVNWDGLYQDIENKYHNEIDMIHRFFDQDSSGYYDADYCRTEFNGQEDELLEISQKIDKIKEESKEKEKILENPDDLAFLLASKFGDSAVKKKNKK